MTTLRRALWFATAPLACLVVYWRVPFVWFRVDDFAWLRLAQDVNSWADLAAALFAPAAQGTVRVLSERAYFLTLTSLFGVTSWPFRAAALSVWVLALWLIQWAGRRLTGSRAAGLAAALLWTVNATLATPLAWASAFNQVLCAALMLAAFAARLRWLDTGERRWRWMEATAFLAAFGVLEIAVMYPAAVLLHAACDRQARPRWPGALWMAAAAAGFAALHQLGIPKTTSPVYQPFFDARLPGTLWQYFQWTLAPWLLEDRGPVRQALGLAAFAALAAALGGFALAQLWRRQWLAAFCLGWFGVWLAPVLPLANHVSDYYLTLPGVGLAWLAGWAWERGWTRGGGTRWLALALSGGYVAGSALEADAVTRWYLRLTSEIRIAVRALEGVAAKHPGAAVLLLGMDTEAFLHSMPPGAPRLMGLERVWLDPNDAHTLRQLPAADQAKFRVTEDQILEALERGELRVLDVSGPIARDITAPYHAARRHLRAARPGFVDVGQPAFARWLREGWYAIENGARWSAPVAKLRLPLPAGARSLQITGYAPAAAAPATLRVLAGGTLAGQVRILTPDARFEATLPLPAGAAGEVELELRISPPARAANDPRPLGLIFGTFTVQ
jgi:hypothetical protein